MKEKTISEKIAMELELKNEKDLIDETVKRLSNRLRGLIAVEVLYDCENSIYQICKVEKKRFLGIRRDKLTPFCFIKDKIIKSPHSEYWLEIEMYDEIRLLPIIREEMECAARDLGAKIKVISMHKDEHNKLILQESP